MPHDNPLLTPEDKEALERLEHETRKLRRYAPNRHIEQAGLKPWMRMFAAWYALEGSSLKRYQQLLKAQYLARGRLSRGSFQKLLQRTDLQDLIARYTDDRIAATREQMQQMLPKVVENVEWSIDEARKANDYKAMPAVVEPVLAHTIPKKSEAPVAPPTLVINLGGHFAKVYAERELQEAEVEELPAPKEDDDGK